MCCSCHHYRKLVYRCFPLSVTIKAMCDEPASAVSVQEGEARRGWARATWEDVQAHEPCTW